MTTLLSVPPQPLGEEKKGAGAGERKQDPAFAAHREQCDLGREACTL